MEIARQILSVLLVFTLLGVVLSVFRRGGIPNLREFIRSRRGGLGVGSSASTPQRREVYSSRVVARFLSRPASRTKSLHAVERLTLTPHHSLHLIELHGRELLIATHPQGSTLLSESVSTGSIPAEASPVESEPEHLKQARA